MKSWVISEGYKGDKRFWIWDELFFMSGVDLWKGKEIRIKIEQMQEERDKISLSTEWMRKEIETEWNKSCYRQTHKYFELQKLKLWKKILVWKLNKIAVDTEENRHRKMVTTKICLEVSKKDWICYQASSSD